VAQAPYEIELAGLSKRFGDVQANAGVDLRVRPGTIHAIIGENGAGKSTAMKMLYGIYAPDAGAIRVRGEERRWRTPRDAIAAGIGMVHQHFMLAGPYSALENVMLGAEAAEPRWRWLPRALRPLDAAGARRRLEELARRQGFQVPWNAPVEDLPVGVQQRLEILKLLYRDARVLILDEPTAVLTPQETAELFANLKALAAEGKTILIITHKLKEVMALADRVTVFRAGRSVAEVEKAATSPEELASLMVGRKVALHAEAPPEARPGAAVLEAEGVGLPDGSLAGVSLAVHAGEVVGIAGVEGNGQSELLHLVLDPARHRGTGKLRWFGKDAWGSGAAEVRDAGVGVIPQDRHREGLLLGSPVLDNFLLGLHRRKEFLRGPFVRWRTVAAKAALAMEAYDVRPRAVETAAGGLSGGNQQKLIIAREFQRDPRFLVAAQPTRGVDVGAIESIHRRILDARARGTGVLLVSSELDEILALSDRILVMYEGRIVARFRRGEADERQLGLSMGGAGA
jgi:general nucleoside transport system ATP-binding protein